MRTFILGTIAILLAGCDGGFKTADLNSSGINRPFSTPPPSPTPTFCTPNAQQSCQSGNGTGSQICDASGSAWGACGNFTSCNAGYNMHNGACSAPPDKTLSVPVFDAMYYQGKPNWQSLGIKRAIAIDRSINPNAVPNVPDEATVVKIVRDASATDPAPVFFIDIETPEFPFDIRVASREKVDNTIAYVGHLMDVVHSVNPYAKVGVYAVPLCEYWIPNLYEAALHHLDVDYWRSNLDKFSINYQNWLAANAYLAPLAQKADYVFPSLYTFYDYYDGDASPSLDNWQMYANLNIAEARRYGKPVYPFVWPQFHPGGPHKDYSYIPTDYWAREISYVRYYADGMVLWGWGGFLNESWNENFPWWQATLQFLNTISN